MLGDKLDLLVSFETQLHAWQGDALSCSEFKRQLQTNWPKYESELSPLRLIAGKALNTKLNAIEMSAMDSYSQAVFNLYSYYQHATAKKLDAEARAVSAFNINMECFLAPFSQDIDELLYGEVVCVK